MAALPLLVIMSLVAPGDPPAAELAEFQGTWVMVSMETEGHEVPAEDIKDSFAVYEGNRLTLRAGERVRRRGIVTVDPARRPRAINTWDQDGPFEDQTVPGIYALEGDTLKLCFARPGQERPKEFTTKSGTAFLFCVYKRVKR
jgi:uncharacterized protein (TIGR03067 family)